MPEAVQRQGMTVSTSAGGFLMIVALVSEVGTLDSAGLLDCLVTNLVDEFSRLEGGGNVQVFGAQYATLTGIRRVIRVTSHCRRATGPNALPIAKLVEEPLEPVSEFFPDGMKHVVPYDTFPFVELSIKEVVVTLLEAVGPVCSVMLLFSRNLRATLIPTLAVQMVLLATFGVIAAFGISINSLTMRSLWSKT